MNIPEKYRNTIYGALLALVGLIGGNFDRIENFLPFYSKLKKVDELENRVEMLEKSVTVKKVEDYSSQIKAGILNN